MGLAAVYGTVKNHNGFIMFDSEQKKGTTFNIYLPVVKGKYGKDGEKELKASPNKQKVCILFAAADELVRELARDILQQLEYEVISCSDGVQALQVYKERWRKIDLVLLDMIMPRMNAHQTFVAMKKINPTIIALLTTGYTFNEDAEVLLNKGVKGFIQKPFKKKEQEQKIAEQLCRFEIQSDQGKFH